MKTWKKVLIGVVVAGVLIGIVVFSVNQANKGVVTVQTAKVATQDDLVSIVTASGEVKPTTYTNVTAQGFGRITEIYVKEGDHIKKGDVLLHKKTCKQTPTWKPNNRPTKAPKRVWKLPKRLNRPAKPAWVSKQPN